MRAAERKNCPVFLTLRFDASAWARFVNQVSETPAFPGTQTGLCERSRLSPLNFKSPFDLVPNTNRLKGLAKVTSLIFLKKTDN